MEETKKRKLLYMRLREHILKIIRRNHIILHCLENVSCVISIR